jgi:hypothetical protein
LFLGILELGREPMFGSRGTLRPADDLPFLEVIHHRPGEPIANEFEKPAGFSEYASLGRRPGSRPGRPVRA